MCCGVAWLIEVSSGDLLYRLNSDRCRLRITNTNHMFLENMGSDSLIRDLERSSHALKLLAMKVLHVICVQTRGVQLNINVEAGHEI